MKTQRMTVVTMVIFLVLTITGTSLYAQRMRNNPDLNRRGNNCLQIPGLTEEQQAKIEALRINHLKEVNAYKNQFNELQAKKHTLMTSENADMKEINSLIDQMTGIQNKMMKEAAKHHREIRNILTDEQRVYFDSNPMHRHGHGNRGERGFGHCNGLLKG